MISKIDKNSVRKARHFRTRRYISGTQERPRLNVYRSLNSRQHYRFRFHSGR